MRFLPLRIPDVVLVELEPHSDERGFFARAWCRDEFDEHGLRSEFVQANLVYSEVAGTLRGLHYQAAPHAESKLVRCTRGAIYDVALDLRAESPTEGEWVGMELTAADRGMLYVPEGFAHGYQTLTDDAEVFYLVSAPYAPAAERGVRWDDPAFRIEWPRTPTRISERDGEWPDYVADRAAGDPGPPRELRGDAV